MPTAAEKSPAPQGERKTRLSRRIKKAFKRLLMALAVSLVPRLYMAYMWLVYKTSKVENYGLTPARCREHYGKGTWALWHDEVFFVAYAFREYRPHTLASRGDSGELITRLLELCNFQVFRGGSSSSHKRRSAEILEAMIDKMRSTEGVLYGLTVDGSRGPVYRLKAGAINISIQCSCPLFVERTYCKRYYSLPTWDRTFIPLPFNHIVHVFAGPVLPPEDLHAPDFFARYRDKVERELCRISGYAWRLIEGKPPPQDWVEKFDERFRAELLAEGKPASVKTLEEIRADPKGDGSAQLQRLAELATGETLTSEAPRAEPR